MSDELLIEVPPQWEVKSLPDGRHVLFFDGEEQESKRSKAGLAALQEMASLFNRKKKTPLGWVPSESRKEEPPKGGTTSEET